MLVAALAAVSVAGLVFTAVAGATTVKQIWDGTATPTWAVQSAGSGAFDDDANAVVATPGGVTFVTGDIGNAAGNSDLSLTELVNGVKKWTKTYDGPAHGNDGGGAIAFGPKGIVYTAGWTTNKAGNRDMLLIKWTTTGKRLWVRTYDGPKHGTDYVTALVVDKKGDPTVARSSVGTYDSDVAVVSWTGAGARRWAWRYSGTGHGVDWATDLLAAKDSSIYVTGWAWASGGKWAAVTARISAAGKNLWTRTYAGGDTLGAGGSAIAACPSGGVYVGGWVDTTATGTDGLILRYTPNGTTKVFAVDSHGSTGTTSQAFNDIAVTTGKHVIAAGVTEENDASGDAYFDDYTSSGALAWSPILAYGPYLQSFDYVATDSLGGYYLAGQFDDTGSSSQIYIYRGSQNPGAGFWQSLWGDDASHPGYSMPLGIAVAGSTVWVVGQYGTTAAGSDQIALGFAY